MLAAQEARPSLIRAGALLRTDAPTPMPSSANLVFSTLIVGEDGMAALAYFAQHDIPGVTDPPPLTLVDFSYEPFSGDTIGAAAARLEELHRAIPGVRARLFWVAPSLVQAVHQEGFWCEVFPADALNDLPSLAVKAATHINAGRFAIAAPAVEKSRRIPLAGALSFRSGEPHRRASAAACCAGRR